MRQATWLILPCMAGILNVSAQTLTPLHSFAVTDGANPFAGLVQATNGNFYGTTYGGGRTNDGTIFRVTPGGAFTTLHNFCTVSGCPDGALIIGGLIQAKDGNFYGTANSGGANGPNYGTVFRMTPAGKVTTLYSFCAKTSCEDGSQPNAGLVQGANGDLYGTTRGGGANSYGTVFQITTSGALTTLYSFCPSSGCADGAHPTVPLIQGKDGALYGATLNGGGADDGVVFKITTGGALTTLYSFCTVSGCADGETPAGGLIQANDGYFYGTTEFGGLNSNGTIFKISSSGALTTIYNFCSQPSCLDGQIPAAALVQASDGNLYGTTQSGGLVGAGTIFKTTTSGALTSVYSFCAQLGCADGKEPFGLIQGTNGEFYGTNFSGGAGGAGTVFSFDTGLGPFVELEPTSGKVGATVKILGSNLTGATRVAFHGKSASFSVVSQYEITAVVPSGATTGPVTVVTPGGTLTSNVPFAVRP